MTKSLPGLFIKIELDISILDAIKYCKAWVPHRRWLKSNDVDFTKFPEEKDFQKLCDQF